MAVTRSVSSVPERSSSSTVLAGRSAKPKILDTYDAYQKLNPKPDFDFLAQSLVKMWLDSSSSGYPNEAVTNTDCEETTTTLYQEKQSLNCRESSRISRLLNIPFAGHAAFEEQKEIFMISLNDFLKR